MDPCDLRLREGDLAVRELVADAVPMFEFAVRTTLDRFDLDTAEGRVRGMAAVAPITAIWASARRASGCMGRGGGGAGESGCTPVKI